MRAAIRPTPPERARRWTGFMRSNCSERPKPGGRQLAADWLGWVEYATQPRWRGRRKGPQRMGYEEQLSKVWIFSQLEKDDVARIARTVVARSYLRGAQIVKEGEQAVAFYVIITGKVEIRKGSDPINTLGPGESFGE